MLTLCSFCRDFLRRHRRRLGWVLALALLIAFFFWLGANAPVTVQPDLCKVYG